MFALGPKLYLALKVEGTLHNILPFKLILIQLLLENGSVPVELSVEVIAEIQLVSFGFIIAQTELYFVTRILLKDVVTHRHSELK